MKEIIIRSEVVIDRDGNVIHGRPEDIPEFANKCKEIAETIRTGQDYKVIV